MARFIVGSIVGLLMVVAMGAEAQVSTKTSCFLRGGVRLESQVYDSATKVATVVLSVLPDLKVQTVRECFDRTDGRLRVTSQWSAPSDVEDSAQAEGLAKRAARDVALGDLAECFCGVTLGYEK